MKPITWSMKEAELENGPVDLIWNGYSVTDERKQKSPLRHLYGDGRSLDCQERLTWLWNSLTWLTRSSASGKIIWLRSLWKQSRSPQGDIVKDMMSKLFYLHPSLYRLGKWPDWCPPGGQGLCQLHATWLRNETDNYRILTPRKWRFRSWCQKNVDATLINKSLCLQKSLPRTDLKLSVLMKYRSAGRRIWRGSFDWIPL